MKLNQKANQVRNLNLSENKKEDIEIKQDMLEVLKKKTGYTGRNMDVQNEKRTRRTKIQELAGDDPEKILSLKETLYNEEEKKDLNLCPFPQHKTYAELWKSLTPDKQKEMKENIKISADGKIEMVKMKKKFSILTAEHNGKDIFKGEHVDKNGNTGTKGVTYMTGRAAEKACKEQNKKLLDGRSEVEQFINFFPGENTKEKIFSFVKLFGLEKAGYWYPHGKAWDDVGSVGCAGLSRVDGNDTVYEATWDDTIADIYRSHQLFPSPFVACEDC